MTNRTAFAPLLLGFLVLGCDRPEEPEANPSAHAGVPEVDHGPHDVPAFGIGEIPTDAEAVKIRATHRVSSVAEEQATAWGAGFRVIQDEAGWAAAWAGLSDDPVPAVDFTQNAVILIRQVADTPEGTPWAVLRDGLVHVVVPVGSLAGPDTGEFRWYALETGGASIASVTPVVTD